MGTGLIGNLVCNIRAALPMLPGIILDRICPPEEEPEILPEEEEEPENGYDLVQSGTTDYMEVVETYLYTDFNVINTRFYNHITGIIHKTTIVTSQYTTRSRWTAVHSDALNRGLITQTQYDNGLAQLHNLGY